MGNFGFFGMESFGETTFEAPTLEATAPEFGGHYITAMESQMASTDIMIHMSAMENVVSLINHEMNTKGITLEAALDLHGATLEATATSVGGKVKASIQKLWGHVKSFFSAIRRTFDGMVMSTKEFANKYKSQLEKVNVTGMKHKCYNFTHLDGAIDDVYSSSKITRFYDLGHTAGAEGFSDTEKEKGKGALDEYRGSLVGKGSLDGGEFSKAAWSYFRGGAESETDKKEMDVNVHSVLNAVKSNEKYVKDLASGETKMNKFFQDTLKVISSQESNANKAGAGGEAAKQHTNAAARLNAIHSRISAANTIAQAFINAWRTAVVEQDKAHKAMLSGALSYKKKD